MVRSLNHTEYSCNTTLPKISEGYMFTMKGKADGYDVLRQWPVPVKASYVSAKIDSIVLERGEVAEGKVQLSSNEGGEYENTALVSNSNYRSFAMRNSRCG